MLTEVWAVLLCPPPSRHHEVLENWEEYEIIAVSTWAREGRDYLELERTKTV